MVRARLDFSVLGFRHVIHFGVISFIFGGFIFFLSVKGACGLGTGLEL
jgi:hypothetical protein